MTSDTKDQSGPKRYSRGKRRLSWPLLAAIAVLHLAGLYWLAHALVPDIAQNVEREVIAAFDVSAPEPPPPPPENRPEPDEGAQGDTGEKAVADAATAPPATRPDPEPVPRAASTGSASQSGAADSGADHL